ncbi:MAG: GGDEF domain-containing protein [Peptococcaceae bacterium]|nr:GGDEF domain-containing protein [Peptococcaceae bacterium]
MAPGYPSSLFGRITSICQEKVTVPVEKRAVEVYEMMQRDETITEICAVNDHRRVCGILTREYLFKQFSGQFGYNLSARKTAGNLMTRDFLAVDSTATIDDVAILAMKRTAATVYDAVVVTEGNQYLGVVSVKDLLMTAVNMQVKRASEASPLTGLPGNAAVQGMICDILKEKKSFSIIYLDIDNFKAYNDAYGFSNGDLMIKAVAEAMKESCQEEDFKGHIGGDDFVIISRDSDVKTMCEKIIDAFNKKIKSLYSREDWERGYIVSKNRNGFIENFPMATISIAVVTNHLQTFAGLEELSKAIAQAKKKSKQVKGNSIIIS